MEKSAHQNKSLVAEGDAKLTKRMLETIHFNFVLKARRNMNMNKRLLSVPALVFSFFFLYGMRLRAEHVH